MKRQSIFALSAALALICTVASVVVTTQDAEAHSNQRFGHLNHQRPFIVTRTTVRPFNNRVFRPRHRVFRRVNNLRRFCRPRFVRNPVIRSNPRVRVIGGYRFL
ncbi:MAG: hypothetical protein AAGI66_00790 [Cyanobacteria bacterium P01_H01_bin.74]